MQRRLHAAPDGLIDRNRPKAALSLLALLLPYLSARLDPSLRKKYKFEFELARHAHPEGSKHSSPALLPRCATTPPPGLASLQ